MVGELSAGLRNPRSNLEFKEELKALEDLADKQSGLSSREKQHVKAVKHIAAGDLDLALQCWEWILVDYPNDVAALEHSYYSALFLGRSQTMRDVPSGLLKIWTSQTPYYSHLFSLAAFGFEETQMYDKSTELAQKALNLNPYDSWAIHTMAHNYEMQGKGKEGTEYLYSVQKNWTGSFLTCHNYWHLALLHLENGETEAALEIFENEIRTKARSGVPFNMNDAISLLTRLQLSGVSIEKGRWGDILRFYECRLHDHGSIYNDVHLALLCLGIGDGTFNHLKKSLITYTQEDESCNARVTKQVGIPILQGLEAWNEGKFEEAVSLLYPIRNEIIKIGGSHAQRDILEQILIASAYQSIKYKNLAERLLAERQLFKGSCSLKDRLHFAMGH